MFIRKDWIPLLVFIVAIVGVSLYYLKTRPPKDPILIVKPVEFEKPTAKAPVGEQPAEVGHFHEDGTGHGESHEQVETEVSEQPFAANPSDVARDWASMSPEELEQARLQWFNKAGVPPPPKGYEYIWDDAWVVKRDPNGEPVLNKIGEPYIQVHTITAFAPNPEQARRYKELKNQYLRTTDKDEEAKILSEMYRIEDAAQGPYPLVTAAASGRTAQSRVAQRSREALDQALVDFGLGHLVGTGIGGKVPRPRPLND